MEQLLKVVRELAPPAVWSAESSFPEIPSFKSLHPVWAMSAASDLCNVHVIRSTRSRSPRSMSRGSVIARARMIRVAM